MKKALITGITGMVGSHLADYLLENTDWDIYGACRWRSPLDNVEHLIDRVNKKDRLFFEYADLNDEISLITVVRKVKPDYIFHLAAQSYPLTSFTAPIDTLTTNVIGTCRLLEAVRLLMEEDEAYKPVFMCVHLQRSLERFRRIKSRIQAFMRTVRSILLLLMQYQRWELICWDGIMQKHMV